MAIKFKEEEKNGRQCSPIKINDGGEKHVCHVAADIKKQMMEMREPSHTGRGASTNNTLMH